MDILMPHMNHENLQLIERRVQESRENGLGVDMALQLSVFTPADNLMAGAAHLISCHTGCSYCCRRPVVATRVEAVAVVEKIQAMDAASKNKLIRKILEHAYDFLEHIEFLPPDEDPDESWFLEEMDCPLLEGNLCSIYEMRPLLCRMRHSLSPAEECAKPENAIEIIGETLDATLFFQKAAHLVARSYLPDDDEREEEGYFTVMLASLLENELE